MNAEELYALLEERRTELGLSQLDVGKLAFGKDNDASMQNIRRGSSPSVERLKAIADVLGLEFYIGPPRAAKIAKGAVALGFAETRTGEGAVPTTANEAEALKQGFLPFPYHDRVGMYEGVAPVAFSRKWLHDNSLVPDGLRFAVALDDDMSPRIGQGDHLLIDTQNKALSVGGIIAIVWRGKLTVGQIGTAEKSVSVITFLGARAPIVLEKSAATRTNILGRVVWSGGLA